MFNCHTRLPRMHMVCCVLLSSVTRGAAVHHCYHVRSLYTLLLPLVTSWHLVPMRSQHIIYTSLMPASSAGDNRTIKDLSRVRSAESITVIPGQV